MSESARILLVDDNQRLLRATSRWLKEAGYEVLEAETGTEGLRLAKEQKPDLILLDVMLPDLDGFQICQRLRKDPLVAQVPIVMVTALDDPGSRLQGLEAGADDFISKPFDSVELLAKVRTIARLNRYRRLLEERTQREQAEEALRESEARYRALMESSANHIFMLNRDGIHLTSNGRGEQFGLKSGDALVGRHLRDVYPPEVAELYRQHLEQVVTTGQTVDFEHAMAATEAKHHFLTTLYPIHRNGDLWAAGGICRDITERKRAEQELNRRAENLRAINELAINLTAAAPSTEHFKLIADELRRITKSPTVSVSIYDPDERALIVKYVAADGWMISRVNELLEREIVGFPTPVSEEHYDQIVHEIVRKAPDLHAVTFGIISRPISAMIQKVLDIDHFIGLALTEGDELLGTSVIAISSGRASPSDEVVETFARVAAASLRRRQAEKALRESEEKYRLVVENATVIIIVAQDGMLKFFNPQAMAITGYSEEELTFKPFHEFIHPDDRAAMVGYYLRFLQGEETPSFLVFRIIDKEGKIKWMESNAILITWEGRPATLNFISDITERKLAKDEIVRQRQALRRLSAQLIHAQEAERARLSRELHDELGQALTAISLDLAGVLRKLPPEFDHALRDKLIETRALADHTLEQARRLALDLRPGILDDLGLPATLRWYLNRWAGTLDLEVQFEATGMEERLPDEVETTLYRVTQEALTNVARHAQAGRVRVHLERTPDGVELHIEDDGRGFRPEELTGGEKPQHGAGLLGMEERLSLLDGGLEIESQPQWGTRLRAQIPLGKEAGS